MKKNLKMYKQKNKFSKVPVVIFVVILVVVAGVFIFFKQNKNNMAKNKKIGKNSSSQEIVDYILTIKSYEAEVEIDVKSNKNNNKYVLRQMCMDENNIIQEVLEPSNIEGVKVIKENENLRLENSKLGLKNVVDNYSEIIGNNMDLLSFINNYKINSDLSFEEDGDFIIMETRLKDGNNYQKYAALYVDRETGEPRKMEIKDANKNTTIYIIYNKIDINANLTYTNSRSEEYDNKKRGYVLC